MFKRHLSLMLALCLLLISTSVAYMEANDTPAVLAEADENIEITPLEQASESGEVDLDGIDGAGSEDQGGDETLAIEPVAVDPDTDEDSADDGNVDEETGEPSDTEEEDDGAEQVVAEEEGALETAAAAVEVPAVAEETELEEIVDESAKTEAAVAAEAAAEGGVTEFVLAGNARHTMSRGDAIQLNLNGATATKYKSTKRKVARVSATGLVTAVGKGKTKIIVNIGKKKRTLTLTVVDPTLPTKVHFTLNGAPVSGTITVNRNESITLTAVAEAVGTADTGFKWSSSKKKIARVSNGVITGKKPGTSVITVKTTRGKKQAKIKVKVVDPYKATKVTLNEQGLIYMFKKSTLQLKATLTPSNSTSTIKWSSSNKKVATVNRNGLVTARKKGKAVITCKTSSGKKARVTVKVINRGGPAKGIIPEWSPDEENHFVYRNSIDTYVVSTDPRNSNANIEWTSDNPGVLSVVSYARSGDLSFWVDVQGMNLGTAVLTARDTVTGLTASVLVTVKDPPPPESINLPEGNVTMSVGQKRDIPYEVLPTTSLASNYNRAEVDFDHNIVNITWDSANADRNCLGTSDYNLHVTALNPGTTTVTIRLKNGVSNSFTITVV